MNLWTSCLILLLTLLFSLNMLTPSRLVMSEELPKCSDSNVNDTVEKCCPCFQQTLAPCEVDCPHNYLLINSSSYLISCEKNSSSETENNITTTTVSMVTENATKSENASKSGQMEDYNTVRYCVKSCSDGEWYNNASLACESCDKSCLRCDPRNKCTVCRFEWDNKCYAKCPNGMVSLESTSENGTKRCEKQEKDNDKIVTIAVASSVSAVVLIIIIVAIAICCYRRRHSNRANLRRNEGDKGRTAMSTLINEKQATNKKHASRPAGYENMSQTLPTSRDIQNQGDNVLRYTKDPTEKLNKKENVEDAVEEEDYGNAQMISLAKKTDLTDTSPDVVNEMLEVAVMGDAPKPPMPLPSSKGKKKRKEKSSPPYMDMSGEKMSAEKTDSNVGQSSNISSDLEDYVNVNFQNIPLGRKAVMSNEQETSLEDGMEPYENTKFAQSKKSKEEESTMEDYENPVELHTKKGGKAQGTGKKEERKPAKAEEDDMEDYENTKKWLQKDSKNPEGKENPDKSDGDEMEDYENMKDLELYENVQHGKNNKERKGKR